VVPITIVIGFTIKNDQKVSGWAEIAVIIEIMFLRRCIGLLVLGTLLCACVPSAVEAPTQVPLATQIPLIEPTVVQETPTTVEASSTPELPRTLWVDPRLPSGLSEGILLPEGVERTVEEGATTWKWIYLVNGEQPLVETIWIYAAVAAFPTITGQVASVDLKRTWKKGGTSPLLVSAETRDSLTSLWGVPAAEGVQVLAEEDLLEAAWQQPGQMAIVPFNQLQPRWKVLRVDGFSLFDQNLDVKHYPLALRAGLVGAEPVPQGWEAPASNFDPKQMTTLILTGVTALSRRTAETINEKGAAFLLQDIGDWLRSADLTHISNEVSFNPECSPQRAASPEARFCSLPEYIAVLDLAGADIIELTGNHNLDYGADAYYYSLNLYRERGWKVYGGGETPEEAKQALLVEHNGNRLAFLGCNYAGPQAAWAIESGPGAAPCDLDWIESEVRRLEGAGYLPIVTFQSIESEDYKPASMQRAGDYRRMAEAGAVVVSGSASHWPQSFEFVNDSLIHFGLGNLFFDQMELRQTREAFQDKHIFYQGRYLGVELHTTLLEDAARPRPMSVEEQGRFLEMIFEASGWK
jgi:poly-gamma-glutamate capsule biosynthesis protein CapA/YwtB (metallophosphatase superfamily)